MEVLNFKVFMEKYKLKNDTVNESQLQNFYNYHIYPGDSKTYSDRRFVNLDDGSRGGTHWTCFIVKDNKYHSNLNRLVVNQINFYLNNYLN